MISVKCINIKSLNKRQRIRLLKECFNVLSGITCFLLSCYVAYYLFRPQDANIPLFIVNFITLLMAILLSHFLYVLFGDVTE